jgi:hypothetical protein
VALSVTTCSGVHSVDSMLRRKKASAAARSRAIEYLTGAVDATVQVVPRTLDFDVRLVHQPGRARRLAVTPNCVGKGRTELLDPAQDRPPAHVNASIRKHAGDAFGCSTQLQVVPHCQQDDVTRESMASDEANGLAGGMAATRTAGVNRATTPVVAIASEVRRGAAGAGAHHGDPTRSADPTPTSQNPSATCSRSTNDRRAAVHPDLRNSVPEMRSEAVLGGLADLRLLSNHWRAFEDCLVLAFDGVGRMRK